MNDSKSSLRKQYLAAREALTGDFKQSAAESISKHLITQIPAGRIVAFYAPVRGEVDLSPAIRQCAQRGDMLCLPVVVDDAPLLFRHFKPDGQLVKGRYGILVPDTREPLLIPDTVIVPLVAFDKAGQRLGYGAGYYDRTIDWLRKNDKNVHIIGVAYTMQRTDTIPVERFDQKLDAIVTEQGVTRFT